MTDKIKINNETQWCERPLKPSIRRPITTADIEEFKAALCASYKCSKNSISYTYLALKDEYHTLEEYLSSMWLIFQLEYMEPKTLEIKKRIIYKTRIDIPPEIQKKIKEEIDSGRVKWNGCPTEEEKVSDPI